MLGRRDRSPRLKGFARHLRKESTDAERKLWGLIRNGQLDGFRFRRQHPAGGYIVDYVCRSANLVVELDGGQHGDPELIAHDAERTRHLNLLGLRVLRVPDDEMLKHPDAVVETILRELKNGEKTPHPDPLPEYMERGKDACRRELRLTR
jgi:very-short-patch-repair endonuclease